MASYEENKALYGPQRARQMELEAAQSPMPSAAAPVAPAPTQTPWGGTYGTANDLGAFQQWYNQQQGGNRPEDMERFLQAPTLERWNPYLETQGANAGKYRSMRGAEGYFDKPTECPPGMYPGGPNETDPCVGSGGEVAPKQAAAAPAQQQPGLQQVLAPLQQQPVSAPQPLAPTTVQPLQGSLQSLMGGIQSSPASTRVAGSAQNTGWNSTGGGLQNMLAPLQKQRRVGSWF